MNKNEVSKLRLEIIKKVDTYDDERKAIVFEYTKRKKMLKSLNMSLTQSTIISDEKRNPSYFNYNFGNTDKISSPLPVFPSSRQCTDTREARKSYQTLGMQ